MKKVNQGQVNLAKRTQGMKTLKTDDSSQFLNKKSISSIKQRSPQSAMRSHLVTPYGQTTPTKTPGTPIKSSLSKSSQPQTPIGKENQTAKHSQMRYPEILEKSIKRVFLNNPVRPSEPQGFQSFHSECQNNATQAYEMIGVKPQTHKETNNFIICLQQVVKSRQSSQDSGYVEYVITNKDVLNFLKQWFVSQDLKEPFLSNQSSTRSLNLTKTTKTQAQMPQKIVCEAWDRVPIAQFIRIMLSEFSDVLENHQLSQNQHQQLKRKLKQMIGEDEQSQYVSLIKLQMQTRQIGLQGLLQSALNCISTSQMQNLDLSPLLLSPSSKSGSKMQTKEFSQFFKTPDIKNIKQIVHDYTNEATIIIQENLNQKCEDHVKRLNSKTRVLESLLKQVQNKVTDNFDLFQHETKTKQTITKLKEQVIQSERESLKIINGQKVAQDEYIKLKNINEEQARLIISQGQQINLLQQEIKSFKQPIPQTRKTTIGISMENFDDQVIVLALSPTRGHGSTQLRQISLARNSVKTSPKKGPPKRHEFQLVSEIMKVQEQQKFEEFRFASLLTTQDKGQVTLHYYQLIPILKSIPGLNEFFQRTKHINFLVNYWIVGVFQSSQLEEDHQSTLQTSGSRVSISQSDNSQLYFKGLTDLYQKCLNALPNISREIDALLILKMFLKLTLIITTAKKTLDVDIINTWYESVQRQNDQLSRFIKCFKESLIHLTQYQVESMPWSQSVTDKVCVHPLLRTQSNLTSFSKIIQSYKYQNPEVLNTQELIQMFYSQNSAQECISIMNKNLNEQDSKDFLDSDAINLIIFPILHKLDQYTLSLLQGILYFKCPGQFYYAQYISQLCKKENVDIVVDLATQIFNKQGTLEIAIKLWEILGAIAKSIGLKHSNVHLSFIVRMYSQNPIYLQNQIILQNIQIVQQNLHQN